MRERSSERSKKKESCGTEKNCALPDYREYHFSAWETLGFLAAAEGLIALIAYLFYRSVFAAALLNPLLVPLYRIVKRKKLLRRKRQLEQQFGDALQSLTAGLQAGYSIENALREAFGDMKQMYGENGMITRELFYMVQGIRNNLTPEELMENLAARSGSEDMMQFGELFAVAKRTGGNLTEILKSCGSTICEKLDTKKEIAAVMAAKRFESRIMDVIPCGIILYIDISSPGFFRCLYHNAIGTVIMTICLAVYFAAVLLSEKIMSVEV